MQSPTAAVLCKAPSRLPAASALTLSRRHRFLTIYILNEATIGTPRHVHDHDLLEILVLEIHHWTGVIPSKQPVELAKWHASSRTNQQRALIPKLG